MAVGAGTALGVLAVKSVVSQVSESRPGAPSVVVNGSNGKAEAADTAKERPKRLNPIKQKQMEERCAFLEEEVPRVEAALALTETQLGVYVSAAETQRLTTLAEELRRQLDALTSEWEELMMQLEE
jgi:ATP-binding cassette subfamily F protein 3